MELRLYKHVYITPFIRLNLYTKGFSISFGHRSLAWITFGQRGLTGSVPTGIPGIYFTETRTWNQLRRRRK